MIGAPSHRHRSAFLRKDRMVKDKHSSVGRFELGDKIASGLNGGIILVKDTQTGKRHAGKTERMDESWKRTNLESEYNILCDLGEKIGFAKPILLQTHYDYNVLVMTRLGPSLPKVLSGAGISRISDETMLRIGFQMVERLEALHNTGWVHMNIIPDHIVTGLQDRNLYLTGLGNARKFLNKRTREYVYYQHMSDIPYGCPEFASIGMHRGNQPRPKDDLEALGYVLIYLRTGRLPWFGSIDTQDDEFNHTRAGKVKEATPVDDLTRHAPLMYYYMQHVLELDIDDSPRHETLKEMISEYQKHICNGRESEFEWVSNGQDGSSRR